MRAVLLLACALVATVFPQPTVTFDDSFISDLIERLSAEDPRDHVDANNRVFLVQLILKAIRSKAELTGDRTSMEAFAEQLEQMQIQWRRLAVEPKIVLPSNELVVVPAVNPATMQHSLVVLNALLKQQFDRRTL